jgi:hypothetical protein
VNAATCGHCGIETLTNPCYRCGTSRVDVTYSVADGAARRELESRKRITRALALLPDLRRGHARMCAVHAGDPCDCGHVARWEAMRDALRGTP